jgi:hypothetical protein
MCFSKSAAEVLQEFNVDPDLGLSIETVEGKQALYGAFISCLARR